MDTSAQTKISPFVHLHVHSQYSLLDGQASIKSLVDKAIKDGMPGIAITDHGSMFGIKDFYNYVKSVNGKAKKELVEITEKIQFLKDLDSLSEKEKKNLAEALEKKEYLEQEIQKAPFIPILGCECYCARRDRFKKDSSILDERGRAIDKSGWHLILLAKNLKGYRNLIKIVSKSWTEGYYHRPRIDKDLLTKYHEGLICTSACLGGEIPQYILKGKIEDAKASILWFKALFGEDYYLELQRHKSTKVYADHLVFEKQQEVNQILIKLAEELGVKLIATNDVHFTNEEDAEAHDHLICLSTGKDLNDPNRMRYTMQEWMKTTQEMNDVFSDIPYVLSNTMEVFNKIEQYSIDGDALMPDFPLPEGFQSDDDYLRYLTYEGAKKKYKEKFEEEEIKERINFELDTICNMKFPGYFLIVQDFINQARKMGVSVGPGRGSAAGSAVAYCLGITDIDPIKYDLLFERFLNPDRISMPDIDVDFDDDGRAEILRWVTEKYGEARVAHIVTYGTMASKSAIKDVARVEGLAISEANRLAKLVPKKIEGVKNINLKAVAEHVDDFKRAMLSPDEKISNTIKYATQLEGNVRNIGVHACGIIIGKCDIEDVVPVCVQRDKDNEQLLVTQYEGSVIEETGLIKMDFLGLKTLSIIKETLYNIKKHRNIDLDINTISLEDPNTYKLYCEGRTIGTFQFESAGMQKYLRMLRPSSFEDLIAMNALYRPGPMEYIPQFIKRKHGLEEIKYDLPGMERYLKDTYGITVYQEQVMLLSRQLANFTRGESDNLRKAMGKKIPKKMAELKVKFIKNGQKNGHPLDVLEKVWQDWANFAKYAFNKSHATCYSWVAYQTAYLKANFPSEYMAGALSRNLNNKDELIKLMDECKAMNIEVLVPDINESDRKFSVNSKGNIRFGLNAISGIPSGAVTAILEEREKNGAFSDIYDLVCRISPSSLGKKTIERLALSGALDSFGQAREIYFTPSGRDESFIVSVARYGQIIQEEKSIQANSLFGADEDLSMINKPSYPSEPLLWSDLERLDKEKEAVGVYLSSNPMAPYSVITNYYCNMNFRELNRIIQEEDLSHYKNSVYTLTGMISKLKPGKTKTGNDFMRITLEDVDGAYEFALFADAYTRFIPFYREKLIVFLKLGFLPKKWAKTDDDIELQIIEMQLLDEVKDKLIKNVHLSLPVDTINKDFLIEIQEKLNANKQEGSAQEGALLTLSICDNSEKIIVDLQSYAYRVNPDPSLFEFLKDKGLSIQVS